MYYPVDSTPYALALDLTCVLGDQMAPSSKAGMAVYFHSIACSKYRGLVRDIN